LETPISLARPLSFTSSIAPHVSLIYKQTKRWERGGTKETVCKETRRQ
jgi:hypothetical protein